MSAEDRSTLRREALQWLADLARVRPVSEGRLLHSMATRQVSAPGSRTS